MANEPDIMAPITTTSGLATSSGQFTAIFTLAALILSFFGFHYSPDQISGWVESINHLAVTLGPILAAIPVLIAYINSRGKIASNIANATAVVQSAIAAPKITELTATPTPLLGGGILGQVVGGNDWKDPQRYENLLHIASDLGVPGAIAADKVNQQIHPAELITGILGMLRNKTKTQ